MENDIEKIRGYYIYKSIVLPNNMYALLLKKDQLHKEASLLVLFHGCLTVDDIKSGGLLIDDMSNQDQIGMSYIFMARSVGEPIENYNQLIIFDKKSEEILETGIKKKAILNIIYQNFQISDNVYMYKEEVKKKADDRNR